MWASVRGNGGGDGRRNAGGNVSEDARGKAGITERRRNGGGSAPENGRDRNGARGNSLANGTVTWAGT